MGSHRCTLIDRSKIYVSRNFFIKIPRSSLNLGWIKIIKEYSSFGYLIEKSYSKGGTVSGPVLSKMLYLDPDARGGC